MDEGTSTAGTQPEEETPVEPIDESLPLRRSDRVRVHPQFYGFHITTEGDTYISDGTLINLDEPNSYKEAMAGPESAKWKDVMVVRSNPCMITKFGIWLTICPDVRWLGANGSSRRRPTWMETYKHIKRDWS